MEASERQNWLDDYFLGRLSEEEKEILENASQEDALLREEKEDLGQVLGALEQHQKRQNLQKMMQNWHQEIIEEKYQNKETNIAKVRNLWGKYGKTISIAATVAIVATFSTIVIFSNFKNLEKKQGSQFEAYKELKRDLDEVKKSQKSMLRKQAQIDERTTPPKASFGATAFVISANGYLVTNQHVVKNASSIFVEHKIQDSIVRYEAKVVFEELNSDLAILKIVDDAFVGFPTLPYAFRNDETLLGESVFTLAYPRNDLVYGEGVISANTGYRGDTTAYQISIPVNPGNSGGPLLDSQGNLVGIVKGKDSKMEGTAFAIKARYLQAVVDSISNNSEIFEKNPIFIPQKNLINWQARPQQIQSLEPFVFVVKIYSK